MTWIGKSVRISKSTYERLVAYQHELRVRGKSEALKMIFDVYDSLGGSRVAPRVPSQDSSPPEPPEISVVVDEAGKPSFKEAAGTKLSDLTQPEVIRYIMRKAGRPMTASEIAPEFVTITKTKAKHPEYMVATILSSDDLFVRLRRSLYALSEWVKSQIPPPTLHAESSEHLSEEPRPLVELDPLQIQATEAWLKCESTRDLCERLGVSHTVANDWIEEVALRAKSPFEIAREFKPRWSPICSIDAKWIYVREDLKTRNTAGIPKESRQPRYRFIMMAIILMRDIQGDVINAKVIRNERDKDEVYEFLRETRDNIGYTPDLILTDGNNVLKWGCRMIYPKAALAGCTFHVKNTIQGMTSVSWNDEKKEEDQSTPMTEEERNDRLKWRARIKLLIDSRTVDKFDERLLEAVDKMGTSDWKREGLKAILRQWEYLRALARYEEAQTARGVYEPIPRDINGAENFISVIAPRIRRNKGYKKLEIVQAYVNLQVGFERFHPSTASEDSAVKGKGLIELAEVQLDHENRKWYHYLIKPDEQKATGGSGPVKQEGATPP